MALPHRALSELRQRVQDKPQSLREPGPGDDLARQVAVKDPAAIGGSDHEAAAAPEPFRSWTRTSRGVVAPPSRVTVGTNGYPLLRGRGTASRSRPVRFHFLGRSTGGRWRCGPGAAYVA